MKHSIHASILLTTLFLAGCGAASTVYDLDIQIDSPERKSALTFASMRVIERRLASMGEEAEKIDIITSGKNIRIKVVSENKEVLSILTDELVKPFKMRVMQEEDNTEKVDITINGHGNFSETGITEEHLKWLEATEDSFPGKGRATLTFTEEGRELMQKVFQENHEKFIGIFVRDQLISKLLVDTDALRDDIVITDIPTLELANVFVDDMNVGLYVTFIPAS
jgi:preprotein translocase subunit SecD